MTFVTQSLGDIRRRRSVRVVAFLVVIPAGDLLLLLPILGRSVPSAAEAGFVARLNVRPERPDLPYGGCPGHGQEQKQVSPLRGYAASVEMTTLGWK